MHVHDADAKRHELLLLDERAGFIVGAFGDFGQAIQKFEQGGAVLEASAGQFANYQGVAQYLTADQELREAGMSSAQVVDPQ